MLKMTDIKLELMADINMFQLIKKGMHAGISYIANIIDMEKQIINTCLIVIAANHQSIYIMYLDGNDLYGWAMSQCLPTGGFK